MNFEAGFLSDNTYGVKHINRLVRSLVTKGIVDYPFAEDESDIGSYNLNGFIQFLSEDGVIPETYKSMLIERTETGYVLNPGMAFLDNGIYIFVETAQEFICEPGMKVYWMHDTLTDKVEFVCAAEYPASGSYLPLAEILEDGTAYNVRKTARAKLPGMVSEYNQSKKISIDQDVTFDTAAAGTAYSATLEIDLGGNNFKHVLFIGADGPLPFALVDLEKRTIRNAYYTNGKHYAQEITISDTFYLSDSSALNTRYDMAITDIGDNGVLQIYIVHSGIYQIHTKNVNIDVYAF